MPVNDDLNPYRSTNVPTPSREDEIELAEIDSPAFSALPVATPSYKVFWLALFIISCRSISAFLTTVIDHGLWAASEKASLREALGVVIMAAGVAVLQTRPFFVSRLLPGHHLLLIYGTDCAMNTAHEVKEWLSPILYLLPILRLGFPIAGVADRSISLRWRVVYASLLSASIFSALAMYLSPNNEVWGHTLDLRDASRAFFWIAYAYSFAIECAAWRKPRRDWFHWTGLFAPVVTAAVSFYPILANFYF